MTSDTLANPAPLGLLGFGITTLLLSLHNIGFFGLDSTILAAAIFMGGVAQMIAGVIEYKRNAMFTATVFTLFAMFWLTFAAVELGIFGTVDTYSLATLFLIFLILSVVLFIGTLRGGIALKFAFFSLILTLIALTLSVYTGFEFLKIGGGLLGMLTGGSAFYIAAADILNAQYQKQVLPL